jgi:hypothetical protein
MNRNPERSPRPTQYARRAAATRLVGPLAIPAGVLWATHHDTDPDQVIVEVFGHPMDALEAVGFIAPVLGVARICVDTAHNAAVQRGNRE